MSAFTHIFLASFPIFTLWNLQMKTRTKVGLMKNSAAIFAVIRTVWINPDDLDTDFPYAVYKLLTFAVLEAAFIIIAACIPSLRPFVRNLGRSLHLDLDHAKSLFIPRGYYHSHSRRHRPPPLVPRDSGSGAMAVPSPRDRYERGEADLEGGSAAMEKRQGSTGNTPPSTAVTRNSIQGKPQEAKLTI
ncbi:MAG: hypothetical protein Q9212_002401 [Teloschistes hypoglaucus]